MNAGYEVAISGPTVVVTAMRDVTHGARAGAVYVFDVGGTQRAKLFASDHDSNFGFGASRLPGKSLRTT